MLSGRDDLGESRMREICMSGSTREREAAVFGLCASHSVLSSLLYWLDPFGCGFAALRCVAGCQPATGLWRNEAIAPCGRPADWQPAKQQTGLSALHFDCQVVSVKTCFAGENGRILIPPPTYAARRTGTQHLRCSIGRSSRRGSLEAAFQVFRG